VLPAAPPPKPSRQPRCDGQIPVQDSPSLAAWSLAVGPLSAAGGLTFQGLRASSSAGPDGSGEVATTGWIPFPADRHSRSGPWVGNRPQQR